MRSAATGGALLLLLLGGCAAFPRPPAGEGLAPSPTAAAVRRQLAAPRATETARGRQRASWLQRFYGRRSYALAWIAPHGIPRRTGQLLAALAAAGTHGLDPDAYGAATLTAALDVLRTAPLQPDAAAALDVALSAAFLAYADDLRRGAVDPGQVSESWQVRRRPADLSGLLETAISLDAVADNLRRLPPGGLPYRRLQAALAQARRAGVADSVRCLRVNLERWRWLPRDLGQSYLLVRIADFELDWVTDGRPETHRVIVGEPYRQTPQFASQVDRLVVNPAWYVPPRIADEELAARLRQDPEAMAAAGFEVWTAAGERLEPAAAALQMLAADLPDSSFSGCYRLVQRPGGANPLGRVKLTLDNPFAVYLHDTPADALFARTDRDLSHGCIRVEGAVDLVRQLLEPFPAQRRRFEDLLASGTTGTVELPVPVPTYILYWTASVTPSGRVRWAEDLYAVDPRLLAGLDGALGARPWLEALTEALAPGTTRGEP